MNKKPRKNSNRKIDKNWKELFNKYDILEKVEKDGSFVITAAQINEFKEARLMTKFDYINSLPDLFYNNGLSILPLTKGSYAIGRFEAYSLIEDSKKSFKENRIEIPFPDWIETLDYQSITSESSMLNAAYISGMIHDLFGVDNALQTISGRSSSGSFDFVIHDTFEKNKLHQLKIMNSQLEIDAGFETENSVVLIEAKNNKTSSFLIRQLYYPYRLWKGKVQKEILPVFLQYQNGTYNFSVFEFEDPSDYNSLQLIERKNYIIAEKSISMKDITDILSEVRYVSEPTNVPFPQANNFMRIIEMLVSIDDSDEGKVTLEELTLQNDFVYRQAQYYSRAAIYLEVAKLNNDSTLALTNKGMRIMESGTRERKLLLIRQVLSHRPFAVIMKARLQKRGKMSQSEIYEIISKHSLLSSYDYSSSTQSRRGSTINAWITEILSMVDDY